MTKIKTDNQTNHCQACQGFPKPKGEACSECAQSFGSLIEMIQKGEDKYQGIFHDIPFQNPQYLVDKEIRSCTSFPALLKTHPEFGGRTPVEILLDLPDSFELKYPDLIKAKRQINLIKNQLLNNLGAFTKDILYSSSKNLLDAQNECVKEFVEITGKYKVLKIEEAIKAPKVSLESAQLLIHALESVSTLVPDKYKKNVPPLSLRIREEESIYPSGAALDKTATVVLKIKSNNLLQAAECFHEYIHLVEVFNPKIMEYSNKFLKRRTDGVNKTTIEDIKTKYNKKVYSQTVDANVGEIKVYEGHFSDPYAGRTYGALGEKAIPTEVLSVGCESLYLDPIGFYIKDYEYYRFISHFLKGQI